VGLQWGEVWANARRCPGVFTCIYIEKISECTSVGGNGMNIRNGVIDKISRELGGMRYEWHASSILTRTPSSRKKIRVIRGKTTLCHNRVLKVFSVRCQVY
jgi:hypothetical protein